MPQGLRFPNNAEMWRPLTPAGDDLERRDARSLNLFGRLADGVTRRQAEVLALLGLGLSDADIAARLHLSAKTVGHHVSAILDKLAAGSRGEAVHRGRQLGLPLHEGDRPAPGQLR
jgi:DNA-binding NarL/FixJ family response regulator